jgi:hypothetical protein
MRLIFLTMLFASGCLSHQRPKCTHYRAVIQIDGAPTEFHCSEWGSDGYCVIWDRVRESGADG